MSTMNGLVSRTPADPSIGIAGVKDADAGSGETFAPTVDVLPGAPVPARRRRWLGWIVLAFLLLAGFALALYAGGSTGGRTIANLGFTSNNSYIEGLYANVNAKKTATVFGYVFRHLEDEVTVYPSENYYYFNLVMRGKTLSGDLYFDVLNIDSGIITVGFVEKFEDRSRSRGRYRPGWGREFGPADGLLLRKVNDFRYAAEFGGRTVIFNFYHGDTAAPVQARLMHDEVYVGPSFDESGLRFFLVFNKTINRLYWVLNEDGFVPEEFSRLSDHLVMGDRTEFAFYVDSVNNRKILVGVQGLNVGHNNWYDGPFDQLPDNYVKTGRIEIRPYLEAHFGYRPGVLDRYGNYIGMKGRRAALTCYAQYFSLSDLSFVDSCLAAGLTGSQLYGALTLERLDIDGPLVESPRWQHR